MRPYIVALGDIHFPFHDERAIKLVGKVVKALKPEKLLSIGDALDMYYLSSFSKTKRLPEGYEEEVKGGNKGLDILDSWGVKDKIITLGNHEARLDKYVARNCPDLEKVFTLETLYGFKKRGWKVVGYGEHIKFANTYFTHDAGPAGKYALHQTYAEFHQSVAFGHTHALGVIYTHNATGQLHYSVNLGWLGSNDYIDYTTQVAKTRKYTLGFGIGYKVNNFIHMQVIPINKYTCVVNGKVYKG